MSRQLPPRRRSRPSLTARPAATAGAWTPTTRHDSLTTSTPAGQRLAHPDEPFLIILSSAFNTGTTAYEARRDAIRDRCGARLVYWQASHLTAAALAIEKSRLDPAEREQLPWERYFAQGRPSGGIDAFTPEDTA